MMAPEPSPEEILLAAEIRVAFEEAIRALPERQRTVLVLRDVGAADEVCSLLDVSTGNQRPSLMGRRYVQACGYSDHRTSGEGRGRPQDQGPGGLLRRRGAADQTARHAL
ncbi:MAG: RNA polymerase sigma factor [Pseudonocardiaceae bacterium]